MRRLTVSFCLLLSGAALALDRPEPPIQNPLGRTSDFLLYHPDQSFRLDGLRAYQDGKYDFALRDFRAASRFADKPSQAMVASIYWEGRGVEKDRALAYAWSDLAAERGYPWLVATRERYWQEMSDDERKRAVEIGVPLYAEYGDAVAQYRLSIWLRRGRLQTTGSHTGFVGTLVEMKPSPSGLMAGAGFDSNSYYAARYWEPKEYLGWQNSTWHPESKGKVDVGTLQSVPAAAGHPAGDIRKDESGQNPAPDPDQH